MLPDWLRPLLLLLGGLALLGEEALMRDDPRTILVVTAWIMLGLAPYDVLTSFFGGRSRGGDDK